MHKLLKRQIEKYFGGHLPDVPGMDQFIMAIGQAYTDDERRVNNLENILEVSTGEAKTEVENIRFAIEEASLVAIISRGGKIFSVNKNLEKLTGLNTLDFINKRVIEVTGEAQKETIEFANQRLSQGNIWQGEVYVKTRKGNKIWLSGTVTPMKDAKGVTTRHLAIFHDITARKLFEDEIISSEKKYRNVINSVRDIILQADKKLEFTFLNQAWNDITSYSIEETLGTRVVDYIHIEDLKVYSKLLNTISTSDNSAGSCLVRLKCQNEEYRWADLYLKTMVNANGEVVSYSGTIRDITEARRNEDLLSRSNAFQRAILDAARQAIISTDVNGTIKTFNSGAERISGHQPEDVIGINSITKLIQIDHDESAAKNFNKFVQHALDNNEGEIECRLIHKFGQQHEILLSISTIKDNNGNTSGYLFIANDITLRKTAEKEVRKLSTILEESPDFVCYYNMAGELLYSNKAYKEVRHTGGQETNLDLYPSWAELIIKRKAIPHAINNGSWKGETAIIDKQGNEIPVHHLIIIHKDEDGNPIFRSSVMRDITQRKQYEYKLLQSEKRNRDLVNYSQAIIATHDLEGKILTINPTGCNLLEYSLEEMVGNNIMEFMPVSHRELFKQEYLTAFNQSKTVEGILYLLSKTGKQISLLYKNYKVDEPGEDSYIIGFAQDITRRLIAEAELKAAKQSAEESAKAKELFLANMSHEIRTPMNGIVGLTNLLLKSTLNEKQREYTASVKQSAENLLVIINDILDFSKIHAGKLEITKSPFDLNNLLYNIGQTFKIEANRKNIELRTLVDDKLPPYFSGDQIRINQVMVNLISNALKFTEKGQITISAELVNETKQACRIRFSVQDSGIGIPAEKIEKIFNSFTQANADTSRKYGGTGLGLSIVKNLLELMGSTIKVESTAGKGSKFLFELNLEKTEALIATEHKKEEEFTGRLKGVKILMAEDNKVNQLFASELISDWGADLDIADNGKIAVEMVKRQRYDLVLMDIQMPEMSGLDATKCIRQDMPAGKKDTVIIAMTANAMKGDEKQYRDAGMNDVVFKPYQAAELYQVIKKHLPEIHPTKPFTPVKEKNEATALPVSISELQLQHASMHVLESFSRGKNSFIVKMLKVLLETVPTTVDELNTAINNSDWVNVNKISHKLIPNMNMMGNMHLEKVMKWIEDHSKEEEFQEEIKKQWPPLKEELHLTIKDLEKANNFYINLETSGQN